MGTPSQTIHDNINKSKTNIHYIEDGASGVQGDIEQMFVYTLFKIQLIVHYIDDFLPKNYDDTLKLIMKSLNMEKNNFKLFKVMLLFLGIWSYNYAFSIPKHYFCQLHHACIQGSSMFKPKHSRLINHDTYQPTYTTSRGQPLMHLFHTHHHPIQNTYPLAPHAHKTNCTHHILQDPSPSYFVKNDYLHHDAVGLVSQPYSINPHGNSICIWLYGFDQRWRALHSRWRHLFLCIWTYVYYILLLLFQ